MTLSVKEAVEAAKSQISVLFDDEGIKNLGLEEVAHEAAQGIWRVTIGFSRPWDEPRNALAAIAGQNTYWRRTYKVVTLDHETGNVVSVRSLEDKA